MHATAAFFNTIILLGALQGFILGSLLFFSTSNRQANRLLAWLLFLVALASLKLYGINQGWFDNIPFLRFVDLFVPMIIIMPVGPLIFLYVKSSLYPDYKLSRKDRFHFYPVIADLLPQLTVLVFFIGVNIKAIKNDPAPWGRFMDALNVYSDIPRWASVSFYTWMAARQLAAKKSSPEAQDRADQVKWLRQFIRLFLAFQCIWLAYLIPYVIPRYTDWVLNRLGWYPVYVPLAVLIYWLGIKGYLISHRALVLKKNATPASALPASVVEQAIAALKEAMETGKLYLDPALNLALAAQHTGLAPKTISAVLNQHLHKSFNEFVNEYRVLAVKEKLLKEENKQLTIAGLAYECGFNSLPTFQRAFKAVTGLTPKEFLAKNA